MDLKQITKQIKDFLIKKESVKGIYVDYLMKRFNLTKDELLSVCISLQHEGILAPMYELRCPNCIRQLGIYETLSQVPEDEECIYCGEDNIGMDCIMVYFKTIRK